MDQVHVVSEVVHEITLSGDDVTSLGEYVKYRPLFKLLLERGVFTTRSGSVTLHFDSLGNMRKIDTTSTASVNLDSEKK